MEGRKHVCNCGCNHNNHKIDIKIPTDSKKIRNKNFTPTKSNPFYGDAD